MNTAQLTKPSRITIEQDSDPTLLIFKRQMLGSPFDEQLSVNDARWSQTQHGQMPFLSTRSNFPCTNNTQPTGLPLKNKRLKIPRKNQISTIQKSTSMIYWLFELLLKLHTQTGRTTHTVLPTTQNN